MDFFDTRHSLELSGIHPEFGIPMSIFSRYPPGISIPSHGVINEKRLKENFFNNTASINAKLHDFNQMYQKFASGLFELAYPALPPGHPLYSRQVSTVSLQSENNKLRTQQNQLH